MHRSYGFRDDFRGGQNEKGQDLSVTAPQSDEDFERVITKAANTMPELFDKLDTKVLQDAMERNMGAAMVNGAVKRYEASPLPEMEKAEK